MISFAAGTTAAQHTARISLRKFNEILIWLSVKQYERKRKEIHCTAADVRETPC